MTFSSVAIGAYVLTVIDGNELGHTAANSVFAVVVYVLYVMWLPNYPRQPHSGRFYIGSAKRDFANALITAKSDRTYLADIT